ncbi:MAG: FtsQ-type POTRA domain-containing protein [Bdellovibrionales bacterium]|nr:FtsQ-type POTRA domain-containing protein [Bdellovibrionales bacterium]
MKSKWFLLSIAIVLMGLMGHYVWKQGWLKIDQVDLELASNSEEQKLFETMKPEVEKILQSFTGKWLWEASLKEIRNQVLEDARIQEASVYRVFPQGIRVEVFPQKPVMSLLDTKGRFNPVAHDGTLLPPLKPTEVANVPLLRGLEFFENDKLRKQAVELFESLPSQGVFSQRNISELRFSKDQGFCFFLMDPPLQIIVGESALGPKAKRVEQVLHYMQTNNVKSRVIDATLSKKVVVRVRNDP